MKIWKRRCAVVMAMAMTLGSCYTGSLVEVRAEETNNEGQSVASEVKYDVPVYRVQCGSGESSGGGVYNNTSLDQPYNPQENVAYHWGYNTEIQTRTVGSGDEFTSTVRMNDGNDGARLKYFFELPKGTYTVKVIVPWVQIFGSYYESWIRGRR